MSPDVKLVIPHRELIQQARRSDPIKSLADMVGRDVLIDPGSEIVGIPFRAVDWIEGSATAIHPATIPNRRMTCPAECQRRLYRRFKRVVEAEMVARGVQAPCLVTHGAALDIEFEAGTLRAHHERHHAGSHSAAHRVAGGNQVVGKRIAQRHPPQRARRSGVEDLAFNHGSSEGVECGGPPSYQLLEISLPECVDGSGPTKPRLASCTQREPGVVIREVGFVLDERAAGVCPEFVPAEIALGTEEPSCVQCIVPQGMVESPMDLIRPRLSG